jgi:hypothetical protein
MKKFLLIVGCCCAAALFLVCAKDFLIKTAVIAAAKSAVGVNVTMQKFSVGFVRQSATVRGMKVYNPKGFPSGAPMADIPEIDVTLDGAALMKGELHVPRMRLILKEIRLIKNRDGLLNVNALQFAQKDNAKNADKSAASSAKPAPAPEIKMRIDELVLGIGKVIMEDYTSGKDKPEVTVFDMNMKERTIRDIKSQNELAAAVFFQALIPTGLDDLLSFKADDAKGVAGRLLNTIGGLFKGR